MKRLLVMRHAKSDWSQPGLADHDRPLNGRGEKAAATMGRVLRSLGEVPQLAITSSAVRARATVERAAAAGDWETTIEVSPDLYGTTVEEALEVAARAPSEVDRLMIVGHEPAWGGVVNYLTGGSVQVKTATVVGIDCYAYDWPELPFRRGELVFVLQPRMFDTWVEEQ